MSQKEIETWQQQLKTSVTDVRDLYRVLKINEDMDRQALDAQQSFACRVPHAFISRMKKGDENDPLLLQVLPVGTEMQVTSGFSKDPLDEKAFNPVPGLLHKYDNRVLLTLTGACAVNCRYCFRRHFPYEENMPSKNNWLSILKYIEENKAIDEVILSGGDPLLLKDNLLTEFVAKLEKIKTVKRLRIHTRLPVVIPERVTDELVALLTGTRFDSVLVIHCNHPNEIDQALSSALLRFQSTRVTVLNQSVLLKNINDDVTVLAQLSLKLLSVGVLPYYLHQLDPVEGAGHFMVSDENAKMLMQKLKAQLPGYLVPKLAREVPGMKHKQF